MDAASGRSWLVRGSAELSARSSAPLIVSIVTSGAIHIAAAAVFLAAAPLPESGFLKSQTEAISLETTQSYVLESTVSEQIDTAEASAAAMPEGTVQTVADEPTSVSEVEEIVEKEEQPPPKTIETTEVAVTEPTEDSLEAVHGAGEPAEVVQAKAPEVPLKKEEPKEEQKAVEKPKKAPEKEKQHRRVQPEGGATARAKSSNGASSSRASASRGSVLNYAARVRAKVAGRKPSGRGHRGTARVSFGVSSSGGLSYVRLSNSSGNSALDRAAVAAVRGAAPFGRPPAGASPGQLRFSIPFYFR